MTAAVTVLRDSPPIAAGFAASALASSDIAARPAPAMPMSAPPVVDSHGPAAQHGVAQATRQAASDAIGDGSLWFEFMTCVCASVFTETH